MRTKRRTARSILLWTIAAFVMIQVGMVLLTEFWVVGVRDPSYGGKSGRLQRRVAEAPKGHALVVMLGSSRTADGLAGQQIEQDLSAQMGRPVIVFNFGIPAAGPAQQYLHLRRLLADGVRPDLLLIEVFPLFLDEQMSAPRWIPAERLGFRDFALVEKTGIPTEELRRDWRSLWLCPWHTHRFTILSRLNPNLVSARVKHEWGWDADDSGWVVRPPMNWTPEVTRTVRARVKADCEPILRSLHVGGLGPLALDRMLEACRAKGISVGLVVMPEDSQFRSWYAPGAQARVEASLQNLGLPIINGSTWLADEHFFDGHHMNNDGAAIFSRRLANEAILPLLRRCLPVHPSYDTNSPTHDRL